MSVAFQDIADEFGRRVRRVVWCSAATIDPRGRTRMRVVHPIWDGATGWISSNRGAAKGAHLAHNPYLSLCYLEVLEPWGTEQVYVDCTSEWADDAVTKKRVWDLFASTEPPLGFDPGVMWTGPEDPEFGLLKLTPWRIELASLRPSEDGWSTTVWRPS